MYTKDELNKKVMDASARFLEMRGMNILDRDFEWPFGSVDIVAKDEDGTIRFVHCYASKWDLPTVQEYDADAQRKFERIAISWLDAHPDETETMLAFDVIDLGIFGSDYSRAILRHHRNVLEVPDASMLEAS